ncbi:dehydrodolichyl diphosphate synthase complex subunit nus1-like [Physella acuta]|uniref:dehydrodolichyl diphosphate synthase complex subunit nus1-like n=1 Tax=Physella acuta TaxID=109671 RepID=UPI0027DD621B|nr:dehydrodolichyl diphosphate synthase complex subunit nus1-like [Physella acuta]
MKTILLRLIHYLISLGEFLRYLILFLPAQTISVYKKSSASIANIQSDSKKLKKLPAHLGFLVVEDEFSFKDLANMIVWSVALGISYISVYDINGEIKRNSVLLQQNIDASKEEVMGTNKNGYDIQLYSSPASVSQPVNSGSSKVHHANVYLLCIEDSHRKIVDMSRHLSNMVNLGMFKLEDISPSNVDTLFQESLQFPDPELCIKFGSVDSLFGYLPWQIRLTEIISLPSHKGIIYKSFLSSLVHYGNINQRFGK